MEAEEFTTRHPWVPRVVLMAGLNAIRGVVLNAGFSAGAAEGVITTLLIVLSLLIDYFIVKDGEQQTTPVADPRDHHMNPMLVVEPDPD